MDINDFQKAVHENAVDHGWWEPQGIKPVESPSSMHNFDVKVQRTFGDLIALCHSELSEALEAYRDNGLQTFYAEAGSDEATDVYREGYKPEGAFVELADCIIRILDMAGHYGVDMELLLFEKHQYNKSRPYRHGGKKL